MTRPDNPDGDQPSEITPDLWEPLSDDVFSQMVSAAMDPLAPPMDLSVIPDEDEELVGDEGGDGDLPDTDAVEESAVDDLGAPDILDDLFGDGSDDGAGDGSGDAGDDTDDGVDDGDAL